MLSVKAKDGNTELPVFRIGSLLEGVTEGYACPNTPKVLSGMGEQIK